MQQEQMMDSGVADSAKALVEKAGLEEGSNSLPAEFVVERAFVG